jgi:cytochrome b involved in lipid metabolism
MGSSSATSPGESLTQAVLIENLKRIVKSSAGAVPMIKVVAGLYKEVPGAKEYIKDELATTVGEMMKQHPRDFVFSDKGSKVQSGEGIQWFTMEEVRTHCVKEDGWIVVEGDVYDITEFIRTHWGWNSAGKNSTIIAIMSALGSDCTRDFLEVHRELAMWPAIQEKLESFRIGKTVVPEADQGVRVQYRTWEQLVEMGRIPPATMPYKDEETRKWIIPQVQKQE